MKAQTKVRLSFVQTLVWHSIVGRSIDGTATTTDRQIAAETALKIEDVKDVRRGLQAAGLLSAARADEGSSELVITIHAPKKATAS